MRKMRKKSVVIWRTPAQLGDTLVALPAMVNIQKIHENKHIVLVYTQSKNKNSVGARNFASSLGIFDEIIEYKTSVLSIIRLARRLISKRIDRVYYMTSSRKSFLDTIRDFIFLKVTTCNSRIYGMGTKRKKNEKESDRLMRIVKGINNDPELPLLKTSKKDKYVADSIYKEEVKGRIAITLCTGTKMQAKRWPIDRYIELMRKISQNVDDVSYILIGGGEDKEEAEKIKNINSKLDIISTCGRLSITESAEVISRSNLFIGNDTGAMHLAGVMGVPIVAIFSAHNKPYIWEPIGKKNSIIRSHVSCTGCMKTTCPKYDHPCMKQITVEDVIKIFNINDVWSELSE